MNFFTKYISVLTTLCCLGLMSYGQSSSVKAEEKEPVVNAQGTTLTTLHSIEGTRQTGEKPDPESLITQADSLKAVNAADLSNILDNSEKTNPESPESVIEKQGRETAPPSVLPSIGAGKEIQKKVSPKK